MGAMRQDRVDFLLAEHAKLAREFSSLMAEFETLAAHRVGHGDFRAKLRHHRLLIANHRFARSLVSEIDGRLG